MNIAELLSELDLPESAVPAHIHQTARCERRACYNPLAYRVGFRVSPRSIITVGLCAPCAEPALDDPRPAVSSRQMAVAR